MTHQPNRWISKWFLEAAPVHPMALKKMDPEKRGLIRLLEEGNLLKIDRALFAGMYALEDLENLCSHGDDYPLKTALHLAIAQNNIRLLVYLLDIVGVEVDGRSASGCTPLYRAAMFQNYNLVQALLRFGANPLILDPDGNLPSESDLMWNAPNSDLEALLFTTRIVEKMMKSHCKG